MGVGSVLVTIRPRGFVVGFPRHSGFQILVDRELMSVTRIYAMGWSVSRGVDGTVAAAHGVGAQVLATKEPMVQLHRMDGYCPDRDELYTGIRRSRYARDPVI